MKKTLLFVVAIAFLTIRSLATIHMVTVQDFQFSPSSMNVKLGDTVMWMWVNGTHTTSSTQVPAGAAAWDNNITSASVSFMYVPTVAGAYNYRCNVHPTLMSGSFTVVSNTAVASVANTGVTVYPNPASADVHLQFADPAPTSISVINVLGSKVSGVDMYTKDAALNVKDLPNGTYIVNIAHGDLMYKHELLVVH